MNAPLAFLLAAVLVAGPACAPAIAAEQVPASEAGFPLLEPRQLLDVTSGAESQTFDLTIDAAGRLVIGNLGGVLIHDGAWWKLVPIGDAQAAFALAAREDGTVGVGGVDELGILSHDDSGEPHYRSLAPLLPPEQRALGQVHTIRPTRRGFLFHSENWLLAWNGRSFETLADLREDTEPSWATHRIGADVYVWSRESGLHKLSNGRLVPVDGGSAFAGRRIDLLVQSGEGLLVSIRNEGLFRFDGGRVEPLAGAASDWVRLNRVISCTALPDGRLAVGSVLGGLLLLNRDGTIDHIIDTDVGLPDDLVTGTAVDRDGTLWVGVNEGIVRVDTSAGLSVLDSRNGLKGSTYSMIRHDAALWVGTSAGTFTTDGAEREDGGPLRFRRVPEIPDAGWSMLSLPGELLIGTDSAIYSVTSGAAQKVDGIDEVAYTMVSSTRHPGRIWIGLNDGLAAIRRGSEGTWINEGTIAGVSGDVRTIIESPDGSLWCGTSFSGYYRIRIEPGQALSEASVHHFPVEGGKETYFYEIDGAILAVRERSIYELDTRSGALRLHPELSSFPVPSELSVIALDSAGNLWMNSHPPAMATGRSGDWTELRVLQALPPVSIEVIMPESDGVVWLGTGAGVVRYSDPDTDATGPLPQPVFSRITTGGEIIAARGSEEEPVELLPSTRRLRVEISPLSHRPGLRYQTRLLPAEEEWSPWTREAFIELTSLAPGRYVLEARTSAAAGSVSPPARWEFTVRAPWYRTRWAIVLWVLLALLLANAYARHRSKLAGRRAEALERRVADQTRELQHSVSELELATRELEDANRRLEQLIMLDDLTQLANRRHFLVRLTEEWRRSRRHQIPLALILMDLDHFKQVNDSRGHQEGDHCLEQIGSFLAKTIRRSGEVVARYGGEEFAVLLPNTTLDEATELAERLRAGIEGLAIDAGTAPGGIVTASLGVAGAGAGEIGSPDELLARADEAMYAAKDEGRNRVKVAPAHSAPAGRA